MKHAERSVRWLTTAEIQSFYAAFFVAVKPSGELAGMVGVKIDPESNRAEVCGCFCTRCLIPTSSTRLSYSNIEQVTKARPHLDRNTSER